jgi:Protein of unknown function (DUF4231)
MGERRRPGSMPLVARFPRVRGAWRSCPVIDPAKREAYPAFAADFEVLDRLVAPAFAELDETALREQNRHRRQQVVIALGSALITGLGGLQAALPGQRWPGVLLAVLAVILTATSRSAGEQSSLDTYLDARVKAERLRAMHFRYLSATGPYAGARREEALRRAVLAVQAGTEPE